MTVKPKLSISVLINTQKYFAGQTLWQQGLRVPRIWASTFFCAAPSATLSRAHGRSLSGLIVARICRSYPMKAHTLTWAIAVLAIGFLSNAYAEQPPAPCHPNLNAAADRLTVATRGDVVKLPDPLKDRLEQIAARAHTYLPLQVCGAADKR